MRDIRIYEDHRTRTYEGEVFLLDRKAQGRSRSVPLTDGLCRALLPLCEGKPPEAPVFSIRYTSLDRPWRRVRRRAGLDHIRFKDLRAQTPIYGEEVHVPQTILQRTMGHSDESMTRRYQARAAVMSTEQAEAIEQAMLGEQVGTKRRKTA